MAANPLKTKLTVMPKLTVNPDTPSAWEIQLKPGPNLLGRSEANDFAVTHDSVAAMHCQITVTGPIATLKDLGSPAGTLLGGMLVSESRLENGATIQLGEIVLRFETDATSIITALPNHNETPVSCPAHPKAAGSYHCPQCGQHFCELCVNRSSMRGRIERFCRTCGVECETVRTTAPTITPPPPFARQIRSAFGYPLHGDGLILLGAGAVFFFVVNVFAKHAAILGLLVSLAAAGYLIRYYQQILTTSATGRDTMPDWPDFTDFGDLVSPIVQFLGTFAISFGPAIALNIFVAPETTWKAWAVPAALGAGCIYFPMAFMAVAMADSLSALNPLVILPSILKIPGAYLAAVMVLVAGVAASWLGDAVLPRLLPVPIILPVLGQFIGLYLATVEMRILGLLYRAKQDELGWFNRRH
jgi:hypothetical protein